MSRERDFVFNLARLGRERRAHHDCPVCRGRDLASEVRRLRAVIDCENCGGRGWYQEQSGDPLECGVCAAERAALGL